MKYCCVGVDHLLQLSKSGNSMKCMNCDFQLNKQTTWINHDTGMVVDETRLFRIIKNPI